MRFVEGRENGWWVVRDHDSSRLVDGRRVMLGVQNHPAGDQEEIDPKDTFGSLEGGFLWREQDGLRSHTHGWWWSGPGAVNAGGTDAWRPIRTTPAQPDMRFAPKAPALPSWNQWTPPKGWTALASAGSEEFSQQESLHPDALGLIAVNQAGDPRCGSVVYDLLGSTEPDPDRWARLQSAWTVLDMDPGAEACGIKGRALAQNVGRGGRIDGGPGYWLLCDHDHREAGIGSAVGGRPGLVTLGDGKCQHELGQDADGRMVRPGHLPADGTGAFFIWPGVGDGPVHFDSEPFREPHPDSGYWHRVYLRFNTERFHTACGKPYAGKWEAQVQLPFYTIIGEPPPPEDPPPFLPPPGGEPPPPEFPPPETGDGIPFIASETGAGGIPWLRSDTQLVTTPRRDFLVFSEDVAQADKPDRSYFVSIDEVPDQPQSALGFLDDEARNATVFTGSSQKPTYVHTTQSWVFPEVKFKAQPTVNGAPYLAGSGQITPEQKNFFDAFSPIVGGLGAYGVGDGSQKGFTLLQSDGPRTLPCGQGGVVVLGACSNVAHALGDITTHSPIAVSNFVFPQFHSQAFFGTPSRVNSNGLAQGVALKWNGSDLEFNTYNSSGAITSTIALSSLGGGGSGDITEVIAGSGLTGGATSGAATLNVGAGTGITVNADDVALTIPVAISSGGTGQTSFTSSRPLWVTGAGAVASDTMATVFAGAVGGGSGAWVVQAGTWTALGTVARTYLGSPAAGTIGFQDTLDLKTANAGGASTITHELEGRNLTTTGVLRLDFDAHIATGGFDTGGSHASGALVGQQRAFRNGTFVGEFDVVEADGTNTYDLGVVKDSASNRVFYAYDRSLSGTRAGGSYFFFPDAGGAPGTPPASTCALYVDGNDIPSFKTDGGNVYRTFAQTAAQADSTATTVAGIVADFNSLMAKMRTSQMLAT